MRDLSTGDLFDDSGDREPLAPGAWWLKGFARDDAAAIFSDIRRIAVVSPFRHYATAGGRRVAAAMTTCGALGWISDARGYRYVPTDPETGAPWPEMPARFRKLAREAAGIAGFVGFEPDTCLINRYEQGSKMGVHRDDSERAFDSPIVSVSLGLAAPFAFGGSEREEPMRRIRLIHGDVLVWGGPARLAYHGVGSPEPGEHPLTGAYRINMTFRRAG